jgi:hypothetical protein
VPIKNEIAQAVYAMLEALTVFHDRKELTARIERAADDFNALLARARQSFPGAALVHQIEPLSSHDRVIVLVARLAVLKSAVDSELIGLDSRMLPDLPYQMGELLQWVEQHRSEFTVSTAS